MTYSAVSVGQGGTGTVTASGAGFGLTTTNIIQTGATSQGVLTISNGGAVNGINVNVGQNNGSLGSRTVTGADSMLNLIGGTPNGGSGPSAVIVVARNTGSQGNVSVLDGGRITIDGRNFASPGLNIGGASGTGTGSLTISGSGSLVSIIGNSSTTVTASGVGIGREGTGTLSVTDGGALTLALPAGLTGGISVGGDALQEARHTVAGSDTVVVSGAGSKIDLGNGPMAIGYSAGGGGSLPVANGGAVTGSIIAVGRGQNSTGTVTATDGSVISPSGGQSRLNVGRDGTGAANRGRLFGDRFEPASLNRRARSDTASGRAFSSFILFSPLAFAAQKLGIQKRCSSPDVRARRQMEMITSTYVV